MSLWAGSLPEELFDVCLRRDCATVKKLRREALKEVAVSAASDVAFETYVGGVEEVRAAVVEEYARVLSLDVPLREDVLLLLGGRLGWTFEDVFYKSGDPVADSLHVAMMALYMEYVDGGDVERLGSAEFAVYTTLMRLQRNRTGRAEAAEAISQIADRVLA